MKRYNTTSWVKLIRIRRGRKEVLDALSQLCDEYGRYGNSLELLAGYTKLDIEEVSQALTALEEEQIITALSEGCWMLRLNVPPEHLAPYIK